jgi:DNA-binding NarL/FixJ family response regulator
VTRRLLREFARLGEEPAAPAAGAPDRSALRLLTEREREVFDCLGEGLSNHQIAVRLGIGEATVKTHVSRVLQKLAIRSRVQAAILAGEWAREP